MSITYYAIIRLIAYLLIYLIAFSLNRLFYYALNRLFTKATFGEKNYIRRNNSTPPLFSQDGVGGLYIGSLSYGSDDNFIMVIELQTRMIYI